jgi:hypothetical protein
MGLVIDRTRFSDEDRRRFVERLDRSLDVLSELLARPGFGEGAPSLGAELEVSLIDTRGHAAMRNGEVLGASDDPRLTVELDRFNIEANLKHGPLAGRSLSRLIDECHDCLREIERAAATQAAESVMIGILPTLRLVDLQHEAMTSSRRYEALPRSLRHLRHGPFQLDIHGEDDLQMACDDVTYEGAATSFQVHLRVAPDQFSRVYDAIQLATPVVLALAGNSPTFLGRRLWDETRIALFKQAVDHRPERVSFGDDWTSAPLELFRETVHRHVPLLPVVDLEDPVEALASGATPGLRELRLHQSTVWRWNRAIYDSSNGGHLRIEMRALPSGPTVVDMVANATFHIGLALDIAPEAAGWRREIAFGTVASDFYRAAREGLDTRIEWPVSLGGRGGPAGIRSLLPMLLDRAQRGLTRAGVDPADSSTFLSIIERRVHVGQTGASWQRAALAKAEHSRPRQEAIAVMFRAYLDHQRDGEPVDRWRLPA